MYRRFDFPNGVFAGRQVNSRRQTPAVSRDGIDQSVALMNLKHSACEAVIPVAGVRVGFIHADHADLRLLGHCHRDIFAGQVGRKIRDIANKTARRNCLLPMVLSRKKPWSSENLLPPDFKNS